MAFEIKDIDETQAPLLDHLIELRARLLRSLAVLTLTSLVAYYFSARILGFLVRPLTNAFPVGQGHLIFTKLYDAFFTYIKVSFFAGFLISFPFIANQIWAFVAPGLYAKEKRAFLPFLLATPLLFFSGAAFAYYLVMPNAFKFFLNFQGEIGGLKLEALPATGDYLALVMQFIFAFGLCFLLPVLMLLIERAGLVTRQQLTEARRYMIVGFVALGALIAPPDVGSQLLLAVPMWLLYEGSLLVMWFGARREAKAAQEGEATAGEAETA